MGVAAQNFKAVANFMNAVGDGFKLGGFVNNIFRGGYFATIMQPGGNMQGIPVIGTHFKIFERPGIFGNGRRCQETGNDRNPLAMSAGIRRFGVDGAGQNFDK